MDLFKVFLFVIIMIYGLVRVPFARKCSANHNIKSVDITFEKFKVFIAWLGMFLVPMIYIFSGILDRFDIFMPEYVRISAVICMILNAVFFYYIHKELSDNWSPVLDIKEGQKLIKTGIYSKIRHPMYTQCWLWVFFQGLVASNWFVLIFGLVSWGFLYFTRVFNEEKMMVDQFKDEYLDYIKNTGRLFPKLFF